MRLTGAKRYDRIAGYFRASLLDVAGEALETVGQVRIVCNGELDANDVAIAKAALHSNPLPLWRRAEILDRAAARLTARREEFAQIIAKEAAKPIKTAAKTLSTLWRPSN